MQNKKLQSINQHTFICEKKNTNTMDFIEKLVDQLPNILHTTTLPMNTPCLKPTNLIKTSQHGMQANEKHKGKKFCTFALFTWVV